jgi:hypothetical protein
MCWLRFLKVVVFSCFWNASLNHMGCLRAGGQAALFLLALLHACSAGLSVYVELCSTDRYCVLACGRWLCRAVWRLEVTPKHACCAAAISAFCTVLLRQ